MRCSGCGAILDQVDTIVRCQYCGAVHQIASSVLAKSLRIKTINDGTAVSIPQGTGLPAAVTEVFSTGTDRQTSVEIHLLQGESELASENRHVGRFTFGGIAPQPIGMPRVQFTFSISEEGELKVEMKALGTGRIEEYRGLQVEVVKR